MNNRDYVDPNGKFYSPQNAAIVTQHLYTGSTDYQIQQAIDQQNETSGPGIGSLLTDLLVLGAIGGAIWALTKFGGLKLLKSLAGKNKYAPWAIGGAAILLVFFVYSRFKKTASDAQSTASASFAGLKTLNPFA